MYKQIARKFVIRNVFILALIFTSSCASMHKDSVPEIDVYLLGGQSNMEGYGVVSELPAELLNTSNVLLFHSTSLVSAEGPNLWQPVGPAGNNARYFGPEVSFAYVLSQVYPDRSFALIKHAKGGSRLSAPALHYASTGWSAWPLDAENENAVHELTLFLETVEKGLDALVAEGWSPRIAGMLWIQGEADATSVKAGEDYEKNLTQLIVRLRTELDVPEMPFILAKVLPYQERPGLSHVHKAMEQLDQDSGSENALPGVYLFQTDGLDEQGDSVHFNTQGQLGLGFRFGEVLLERVEGVSFPESFDSLWVERNPTPETAP